MSGLFFASFFMDAKGVLMYAAAAVLVILYGRRRKFPLHDYAIIGGAFGLISFLQCFGILGVSAMGAALVNISPVLSFIQRFVTRLLVGLLTALVYKLIKDHMKPAISGAITGFCAAFFNTVLFMSALILLFGHTDYMQNSMAGRGFLAYIVASVGINAVVEMIVAAVLTSAVSVALKKAGLIRA